MNQDEFAEIRRFADQWACQKVHERYWYGEAKRDVDLICSVFTDDARYSNANGIAEIRKKISGYMSEMHPIIENFHVLPIAVDIQVDGDRASGEIRGVAFNPVRKRDGSRKVLVVGVGYIDEFVRTPAGWRISAMRGIEGGWDVAHDNTWQFEADLNPNALRELFTSWRS
ncbi:nuclear transport factor 2 family protein [Phenylobacterium sp. LjRoot219]|uniref:nuclear transport factor 2 family protein n=1 Tax=Phenylobacterium sp. LjRoot219 TaxID=3342283 RepID=UPI003ECE7605